MFFFQVKVIAQEKAAPKQEITSTEIPFFMVINETTSDKEIKEYWESSFDYKIMKKIDNNNKITFEIFKEALDVQFDKLKNNEITYEKLENNMMKLKKHLSIETLKEMKIPNKNIVEYLQHIKFQEKFEDKNQKEKKIKNIIDKFY